MIKHENCPAMILSRFPEFEKSDFWKEYLRLYSKLNPSLSNKIIKLEEYVESRVINKKDLSDTAKEYLDFIEHLLIEGDEKVKDVIKDSFLKKLIYSSATGNLSPGLYIHLLGSESRKCCRNYCKYLGVTIPGL
jgi:hypothetical protein